MTAPEVRFAIRLTPRGGADRIDGVADGTLKVRVAAPAVDGAANEALLRLLATELHVARGAVRLASGATARGKVVAVAGVARETLVARWPGLAV